MRFYWVRNIIEQNHFHIFWEEENKNLADYFTKHHMIGTTELCNQSFWIQQKKTQKKQETIELEPVKGVLELAIQG